MAASLLCQVQHLEQGSPPSSEGAPAPLGRLLYLLLCCLRAGSCASSTPPRGLRLLSQPEAPLGYVTGESCCSSKENKVNVQMSKSKGCLNFFHCFPLDSSGAACEAWCWMWELVGV